MLFLSSEGVPTDVLGYYNPGGAAESRGGKREMEKEAARLPFRRQMKSSSVFPSSATAQRYTGVPEAMGGRALAGPSQTTASIPSSVRRRILIGEERSPAREANSPRANAGPAAPSRGALPIDAAERDVRAPDDEEADAGRPQEDGGLVARVPLPQVPRRLPV